MLQALREQRAAEVERASAGKITPECLSPSRSPRPPWPGQRWRDARREPPGPSGSCSSTGRHPTRSRVIGGRRRDRQSGTIVVFPTKTSTTRSFALSSSPSTPRGVKGIQNKRKRERAQLERRVPGDGRARRARLAVPTQATRGWPLLKLCSSLFQNVSCQKWHPLDFLCPFLKIESIRVSTMRCSKKRFLLCRPKNLPCAPQADLGRLQS